MRVLLIDVNCKNSSTGKIVYDIFSYMNQIGDTASICYGRGGKIQEENIYKFGIDAETSLHAALTRLTGYTGCFSLISTLRLISYIKKFNPDVVHIHELHAYFVNINPLLKYLSDNKIKTIFTLHCDFLFTGKCGVSLECEKWKTGCIKCPKVKDYPASFLFDHTSSMQNQKIKALSSFEKITIVSPSEWLEKRARESLLRGLNCDFLTIHNGVNKNVFFPRDRNALRNKYDFKEDDIIILSAAPNLLSAGKGGNYVRRLSTLFKENKKVRFVMIGVDVHIDEPNIIAIPLIKNQEILAEYYALSDLFLICSKSESFSMTCAEAISCGTPIVGFKCGAPETIFNEPYASFVDYGNIEKLYNAIICKLAISKEEIKRFSDDFTVQKMVQKYEHLYRNITSN